MRRLRAPGYTLVELLVATVLTGVLATAAVRVAVGVHRTQRALIGRLRQQATLRDAAAILPLELVDLGAGDLMTLARTSITYRATRGLVLLCDRRGSPAGRLVFLAERFGLRGPVPDRDSAALYVEGDSSTGITAHWTPVDLVAVEGAAPCADGRAGRAVRVAPAARLIGLADGAPARLFEWTELRLYAARDGTRWLGVRTARKGAGWGITQPVLGPLGVDGVQFVGYDAAGTVVTDPARVARLGVVLTAAPELGTGPSDVTFGVTLRNRP